MILLSMLAFAAEIALNPAPVLIPPAAQYQDHNRFWQGIPGIERTRGGSLWATWYSGGTGEGPQNFVVLARSRDNGGVWSPPQLIVDPPDPVRAYDPCLWLDPGGKLWLFWAQSFDKWDGRGGVWAITTANPDDPSPKWSKPRRIADGVMMNKPTVLADGTWLLPISGWRFKAPDPEAKSRGGAGVYASTDKGRTFQYRGQALLSEPQFDEHMTVERKDGSLWMLVRTAYGIGQSESRDKGATWSAGGPSGIPHPVTRFHLRRLKSGRLLLVRNDPDSARPKLRKRLTAFVSDDDGKSWQGGLVIDPRDSVSYPDAAEAPDGTIYVIYDRERGGAKEILCARIREDDILAGKPVSSGAQLQMLVNKATGKR